MNETTVSDNPNDNYYLFKISDINIGDRKVYALDVDDVIEYLGSNATPQDVNELFFNKRTSVSSNGTWLRSARDNSMAFEINGNYGFVDIGFIKFDEMEIRPAFVIDLSLLS